MARRQRKRVPAAIIPGPTDQSAGSPKSTSPPPEPTFPVCADAGVPVPWGWQMTGMEIPQYRRVSHEAALMQPQSFFWPGVQDAPAAKRPGTRQ
jgi:hypothetical protein